MAEFLKEAEKHATEIEPAAILKLISENYGLIADLEFDRHIIWWMLSDEGQSRAATIAAHFTQPGADITKIKEKAKTVEERAARLFLDYLEQLVRRINTAALRHELRQIGREAKGYFKRKSREIVARPSRPHARGVKGTWVRHIGIPYVPPPLASDTPEDASAMQQTSPNIEGWNWTPLVPAPPQDLIWDDEKQPARKPASKPALLQFLVRHSGFDKLVHLVRHPAADRLRVIVIGDRGVGKGTFLRTLYREMVKLRRPTLAVNCSYGQESDSVVTLIQEFLNRDTVGKAECSGLARSRRARIATWRPFSNRHSKRPLIVIGAADRLFGIDRQPLGADFDWLLRKLCDPAMKIDLIITASGRCQTYFERLNSDFGGAESDSLSIYQVTPETKPLSGEKRAAVPLGFLLQCDERVEKHERSLSHADPDRTRRLMRHEHRREDYVIGRLIENLRGRPVAKTAQGVGIGEETALAKASIGRLAQEMLKALAFIGLPCEAEVLMVTPAVRRELARLLTTIDVQTDKMPGGDYAPSARTLLKKERKEALILFKAALDALLRDNLVGLIEPHVPATAGDADDAGKEAETAALPEAAPDVDTVIRERYRLVLHRLVTRVVRKRFGVPLSETVLSNSFNLTLYAAQIDDAPIFTPEITNELEQMLDDLLRAWHDVQLDETLSGQIQDLRSLLLSADIYPDNALAPDLLIRLYRFDRLLRMADPVVPASLRAANGLVRAFFSSVNLLGLDIKDPRSRNGGQSVLTVHNQRLRTLLDSALEAQKARHTWNMSKKVTPAEAAAIPKEGEEKPHTLANALENEFAVNVLVTQQDKMILVNGIPRRKVKAVHRPQNRPEDWPDASDKALKAHDLLRAQVREVAAEPRSGLRGTAFLQRMDKLLVGVDDEASLTAALDTPPVRETAPLFEEEIVWLFNERGMLFLAQGSLYAASTAFQLADDANSRIEGRCYHPNRCRLLLNQSLLWIERGRIADARRALLEMRGAIEKNDKDALRGNSPEGQLILALSAGYLALCDQLNGLVTRADKGYRRALKVLIRLRHQRSIALFEFHRGSLLQTQVGRREEAAACFARAVAAAEGGRHTDILYRVRIAQAHNNRLRGTITPIEARKILDRAYDYGRQLDMFRVMVEALSTSCQLRLDQGDVEAAAVDCKRAIALASQYGMTLRRIWLRGMAGKVYQARNDFDNARFMFERAISAAERLGFQRAAEDAGSNLMLMPKLMDREP